MDNTLITLPLAWQQPLYAALAISLLVVLTALCILYYVIKAAVRDGMREALSAQPMSQDYLTAHKTHTQRIEPVTKPLDLRATR